jgi:hypothetical protein
MAAGSGLPLMIWGFYWMWILTDRSLGMLSGVSTVVKSRFDNISAKIPPSPYPKETAEAFKTVTNHKSGPKTFNSTRNFFEKSI